MERLSQTNLYIALLHHPVINKRGNVITSAVTNLDLHDISRIARTYGVKRFYVVTPLADQQQITRRIVSYWVTGGGAGYNPDRRDALKTVRVESDLKDVITHISSVEHQTPVTVATRAGKAVDGSKRITFQNLKKRIKATKPHLITLGTAWGLSAGVIRSADYCLEPISGVDNYNHLSVRSAAAIILDRLLQR